MMFMLCLVFIVPHVLASDSRDILSSIDKDKAEMELSEREDRVITKGEYRKIQESHRFYLISSLIAVTPLFLWILLHFIRKSSDYNEQAIIHASGLILVIQATTIVVLASPTTEQLTAAIGVLAAIAGYLFGTAANTGTNNKSNKEQSG